MESPERSFTISVDTREQKPYSFNSVQNPVLPFNVVREALPTGDYGTRRPIVADRSWKELTQEDYRHCAMIERKTLEDFYKTLANTRDRFEQAVLRMEMFGYAAIVIEANLGEILSPNQALMRHAKFHAKSAIASLIAWQQRHKIFVWTCDSRELAERLTHRLLERWIRDCE